MNKFKALINYRSSTVTSNYGVLSVEDYASSVKHYVDQLANGSNVSILSEFSELYKTSLMKLKLSSNLGKISLECQLTSFMVKCLQLKLSGISIKLDCKEDCDNLDDCIFIIAILQSMNIIPRSADIRISVVAIHNKFDLMFRSIHYKKYNELSEMVWALFIMSHLPVIAADVNFILNNWIQSNPVGLEVPNFIPKDEYMGQQDTIFVPQNMDISSIIIENLYKGDDKSARYISNEKPTFGLDKMRSSQIVDLSDDHNKKMKLIIDKQAEQILTMINSMDIGQYYPKLGNESEIMCSPAMLKMLGVRKVRNGLMKWLHFNYSKRLFNEDGKPVFTGPYTSEFIKLMESFCVFNPEIQGFRWVKFTYETSNSQEVIKYDQSLIDDFGVYDRISKFIIKDASQKLIIGDGSRGTINKVTFTQSGLPILDVSIDENSIKRNHDTYYIPTSIKGFSLPGPCLSFSDESFDEHRDTDTWVSSSNIFTIQTLGTFKYMNGSIMRISNENEWEYVHTKPFDGIIPHKLITGMIFTPDWFCVSTYNVDYIFQKNDEIYSSFLDVKEKFIEKNKLYLIGKCHFKHIKKCSFIMQQSFINAIIEWINDTADLDIVGLNISSQLEKIQLTLEQNNKQNASLESTISRFIHDKRELDTLSLNLRQYPLYDDQISTSVDMAAIPVITFKGCFKGDIISIPSSDIYSVLHNLTQSFLAQYHVKLITQDLNLITQGESPNPISASLPPRDAKSMVEFTKLNNESKAIIKKLVAPRHKFIVNNYASKDRRIKPLFEYNEDDLISVAYSTAGSLNDKSLQSLIRDVDTFLSDYNIYFEVKTSSSLSTAILNILNHKIYQMEGLLYVICCPVGILIRQEILINNLRFLSSIVNFVFNRRFSIPKFIKEYVIRQFKLKNETRYDYPRMDRNKSLGTKSKVIFRERWPLDITSIVDRSKITHIYCDEPIETWDIKCPLFIDPWDLVYAFCFTGEHVYKNIHYEEIYPGYKSLTYMPGEVELNNIISSCNIAVTPDGYFPTYNKQITHSLTYNGSEILSIFKNRLNGRFMLSIMAWDVETSRYVIIK